MAESDLSKTDILSLDYNGKVNLLGRVTQELLNLRIEYATVAGKHAELGANISVLREVKSALQTAIKAEGE